MTRRRKRPPLDVTMVVPRLVPLDARERGYKCGDQTHWNEAFDGVAPHPAIGWTVVAFVSAHRPPIRFSARIYVCAACAERLGLDAIPVKPAPTRSPQPEAAPVAGGVR